MMTPDGAGLHGKALALAMMDTIPPELQQEFPVLIHALAFIFAALLRTVDSHVTIHEHLGLGLLGDEERLTLFSAEVRDLVRVMREQNPASKTGIM